MFGVLCASNGKNNCLNDIIMTLWPCARFAKMKQLQKKEATNFREGLKSTGKDKYALDAEEDPDVSSIAS